MSGNCALLAEAEQGSPAAMQQADSTLPIERRRNYKSVVDALVRCAAEFPPAFCRAALPHSALHTGWKGPVSGSMQLTSKHIDSSSGTQSCRSSSRFLPSRLSRNCHMQLQGHTCALHRIVKEDGAAGLFTGAGPTVVRAMALNMGMLASNDQVGRSLI